MTTDRQLVNEDESEMASSMLVARSHIGFVTTVAAVFAIVVVVVADTEAVADAPTPTQNQIRIRIPKQKPAAAPRLP